MNEYKIIGDLFSEYGIIATLFVIMIVGIVATFYHLGVKLLPRLFDRHFEQMDKAHERFSRDLEKVTEKFTKGLDKLIASVSEEHNKQNQILEKISRHQDIILEEVKETKMRIINK